MLKAIKKEVSMRLIFSLSLMGLLLSCDSSKQTAQNLDLQYMHKYGVELTAKEWDEYGQTGKVIHQTSDGIVVSESYVNGILHGETTSTYPNSETIYEVKLFDSGKLTFRRILDATGLPVRSVEYLEEGKQKHISYSKQGFPLLNEVKFGPKILEGKYYKPDGSLEQSVLSGNGTRFIRSFDGQLEERQQLENGFVTFAISFYPNGFPKAHTYYQNNQIHGTRKTFLENGQPLTIESWAFNQLEGPTSFFENGVLSCKCEYHLGQKDGKEVFYDELGSEIIQEIAWRHGLKHGPSHFYSENEITTDWYWEGEALTKFSFDEKMAN